ncbi:MAG: DUF3592 domain-containing protein [Anaerolineae bacterium]|nr:DUF3592 domain-containing protein [Anaerolineae bacterium]
MISRVSPPTTTATPGTAYNNTSTDWTCQHCGHLNTASPHYCTRCGNDRTHQQPASPIQPLSSPPPIEAAFDAREPFLIDPENASVLYGSRTRPKPSGNRAMLFLGLVVFIVGLLGTLLAVVSWRNIAELSRTGLEVQAEVIDSRISTSTDSDGNTSTTTYLTYRFRAQDEQFYNREQSVERTTYNSHPIGSSITVEYAASNPDNSSVVGERNQAVTAWASTGFALVGVIAGLFILLRTATKADREDARHRHGKLISATITQSDAQLREVYDDDDSDDYGVRRQRRQPRYTFWEISVSYELTSPQSGKTLRRSTTQRRDDLRGKLPPPPGTPLRVLYVNDRNFTAL